MRTILSFIVFVFILSFPNKIIGPNPSHIAIKTTERVILVCNTKRQIFDIVYALKTGLSWKKVYYQYNSQEDTSGSPSCVIGNFKFTIIQMFKMIVVTKDKIVIPIYIAKIEEVRTKTYYFTPLVTIKKNKPMDRNKDNKQTPDECERVRCKTAGLNPAVIFI